MGSHCFQQIVTLTHPGHWKPAEVEEPLFQEMAGWELEGGCMVCPTTPGPGAGPSAERALTASSVDVRESFDFPFSRFYVLGKFFQENILYVILIFDLNKLSINFKYKPVVSDTYL